MRGNYNYFSFFQPHRFPVSCQPALHLSCSILARKQTPSPLQGHPSTSEGPEYSALMTAYNGIKPYQQNKLANPPTAAPGPDGKAGSAGLSSAKAAVDASGMDTKHEGSGSSHVTGFTDALVPTSATQAQSTPVPPPPAYVVPQEPSTAVSSVGPDPSPSTTSAQAAPLITTCDTAGAAAGASRDESSSSGPYPDDAVDSAASVAASPFPMSIADGARDNSLGEKANQTVAAAVSSGGVVVDVCTSESGDIDGNNDGVVAAAAAGTAAGGKATSSMAWTTTAASGLPPPPPPSYSMLASPSDSYSSASPPSFGGAVVAGGGGGSGAVLGSSGGEAHVETGGDVKQQLGGDGGDGSAGVPSAVSPIGVHAKEDKNGTE